MSLFYVLCHHSDAWSLSGWVAGARRAAIETTTTPVIPAFTVGLNDALHLLFNGHSWRNPKFPFAQTAQSVFLHLDHLLPRVSPVLPLIARYIFSFFYPHPFTNLLSSPLSKDTQTPLQFLTNPPNSPSLSPSFLCGSLPWCSFYGQQPQAPHLC